MDSDGECRVRGVEVGVVEVGRLVRCGGEVELRSCRWRSWHGLLDDQLVGSEGREVEEQFGQQQPGDEDDADKAHYAAARGLFGELAWYVAIHIQSAEAAEERHRER